MNISILKPQCYSAKGNKPNQEDSLFPPKGEATEGQRVFLVCDGMGGHEKGEVASACVADTIGRMIDSQPLCTTEEMKLVFEGALRQAYDNLDELDTGNSQKKMGTTLTFLAICTDGMLLAHIGDSRIYQLRPGRGVVFRTRDHSLVNDLIAAGEISEAEARNHPQRNVITRAIQPHQEYPARPSYNILTDIKRGDVFLLCCDGVVEQLEDKDICKILLNDESLENRIGRLQDECKKRETRDNNTAYVIEIKDVTGVSEETVDVKADAADDVTLTKPSTGTSRKWFSPKLLIALLALVIILVLVFIFTGGNAPEKKKEASPIPKVQKS